MSLPRSARRAAHWLGAVLGLAIVSQAAPFGTAVGQEARPAGVRTIILVRHGLYDEQDSRDPDVGRALTPQGREQAKLTGARFALMTQKIDVLHSSTMTRARETADIIAEALHGMPVERSRDIRECTPPTVREDIMARERPGAMDSCRTALDRAWERYFRPSPDRDSTEVIVCHGNVIRYFVCRALRIDPKLWLGMSIANCSLTTIRVRTDGGTVLASYGDMGHLPPAMQSFPTSRSPGPPTQPPARADSTAKK